MMWGKTLEMLSVLFILKLRRCTVMREKSM